MNPVDVHILTYNEPAWMLERTLAALEPQPVNVHVIPWHKEYPPFMGREEGFSRGTAPWVSLVDPDDIVYPHCYETLLANAHDGCDGVTGCEYVYQDGVRIRKQCNPHHAFLLRRGLDLWYAGGDHAFMDLPMSRVVYLPDVLYEYHMQVRT